MSGFLNGNDTSSLRLRRNLPALVADSLPELLALRELKISWPDIAEIFQAKAGRVWVDAPRRLTHESSLAKKKAEAEDSEGLREKIEKAKLEIQEYWSAPVAQAPVAVSRPAIQSQAASASASASAPAPVQVAPVAAPAPALRRVSPAPVSQNQKPAAPVASAPVAANRSEVNVSVEIPEELAPGVFLVDPNDEDVTSRPFVWLVAEIAKNPSRNCFFIPDGRPGKTTLPVLVSTPRKVLSGAVADWEDLYATY